MDKGVKGLTTKNLAIEIGFSESALYRHFKNKEDIIVLLLDHLYNNIKERLEETQKNNNAPSEKLKAIFRSQFHYFSHNPHFIIAILSEGSKGSTFIDLAVSVISCLLSCVLKSFG